MGRPPVRATHGFLNDRDVVALRPEVRAGLSGTALYVARDAAGRPFPHPAPGALRLGYLAASPKRHDRISAPSPVLILRLAC